MASKVLNKVLDKTFFTADLHLFHAAMAKHRGWGSAEEMSWAMVERWNQVIYDESYTVYILGDVSLGNAEATYEALEEMNGTIYLVRGNHDEKLGQKILQRFAWVRDVFYFKQKSNHFLAVEGSLRIWLSHYRHVVWPDSHVQSLHLHGHSHGMLRRCYNPKVRDVGVDATKRVVISLAEVLMDIDAESTLGASNAEGLWNLLGL